MVEVVADVAGGSSTTKRARRLGVQVQRGAVSGVAKLSRSSSDGDELTSGRGRGLSVIVSVVLESDSRDAHISVVTSSVTQSDIVDDRGGSETSREADTTSSVVDESVVDNLDVTAALASLKVLGVGSDRDTVVGTVEDQVVANDSASGELDSRVSFCVPDQVSFSNVHSTVVVVVEENAGLVGLVADVVADDVSVRSVLDLEAGSFRASAITARASVRAVVVLEEGVGDDTVRLSTGRRRLAADIEAFGRVVRSIDDVATESDVRVGSTGDVGSDRVGRRVVDVEVLNDGVRSVGHQTYGEGRRRTCGVHEPQAVDDEVRSFDLEDVLVGVGGREGDLVSRASSDDDGLGDGTSESVSSSEILEVIGR